MLHIGGREAPGRNAWLIYAGKTRLGVRFPADDRGKQRRKGQWHAGGDAIVGFGFLVFSGWGKVTLVLPPG